MTDRVVVRQVFRHPWRTKLTNAERGRQDRERKQWLLEMQLEDERWRPNCTCPWHPDPLDPYYQCPDCERRQERELREERDAATRQGDAHD